MKHRLLVAIDFDNSLTKKKTSFYYQCWRAALERSFKRPLSNEEFGGMKAHFSKTWVHTDLALLEAGIEIPDIEDFRAHLEGLFLDYVRCGDVHLHTGAEDLLAFCDVTDTPIGVCSNATETYADAALEILKVRHRFRCVKGYESFRAAFEFGLRTDPGYERHIAELILNGTLTIVSAYAKPGVLPWIVTFTALRGNRPKSDFVPVIVEDRVSNAVGALQYAPNARAYLVRHYDNVKEVIPDELRPRIEWVEDLQEVRDKLYQLL